MRDVSIRIYDSTGDEYESAFAAFLAHTDQKDRAREYLDQQVERLSQRDVFIDAGAGNGKVTAWYTEEFRRTIAIEPNPFLRRELVEACPRASVLPATILEAQPDSAGDFVLASHIFYYVPAAEWRANLARLLSFVARAGRLVVVLQNADNDCQQMIRHFGAPRIDLHALAAAIDSVPGTWQAQIETVESFVTCRDLNVTCLIAEFMLNLSTYSVLPQRRAVEDYVRTRFANGSGYRFSVAQDFLVVLGGGS